MMISFSFVVCGQTLQKYKGDFPDPNKTQNGIAMYEYIEDMESHERIKNGLFVYDFKGVGEYKGFNQNISGTFKDGKREGLWNFSVNMNDFGVKNPYYTKSCILWDSRCCGGLRQSTDNNFGAHRARRYKSKPFAKNKI